MRATQLLGREAVDIDTGKCAGSVRDLMLSRAGQLLCAGIQPADWYAHGLACPAGSIIAASSGRLLYGGCGSLRRLRPPKGRAYSLWSFLALKPLVSRDGASLGTLEDLAFELPSGRLLSAFVSQAHGPLEEIPIKRLTATGPDCVIAERLSPQSAPLSEEVLDDTEAGVEVSSLFDGLEEEAYGLPEAAAPAMREDSAASTAGLEDELCSSAEPQPEVEAEKVMVAELAGQRPRPAAASAARILPRQPKPDEMEARLTDILLASAEALSRQAELQATGQPSDGEPEPAVELSGFRALEALVTQREARSAIRIPAPLPVAADDSMRLFTEQPVSDDLSKLAGFEQRKAQYLTGRLATRDIHAPGGKLLARRGEELTRALLAGIIEAGQLDQVFLEHAAVTR